MAIFLGDTIINKKLLGVNKLNKIMLGTLEIFPNLIAAPTITIIGEWPTNAKVGVPITPVQLTASGGTPPYTFTERGSPIQGVHLNSAGLLSGTPITAGAYNETVTVTDADGYTGQRVYTGTVAPADVIITINGDFPAMTVGVPITPFSFTATGGTAPYTFTVFEGVMPAGLTLASNGLVSGTPSQAGPYSVTIDATDSLANNGYEVFTGDVAIDPSIWLPSELFVNDELGAWWDLQDMGHDGNLTLGTQINPQPEFDASTGWVVGSNNVITGGKFVCQNGWASGQSSYSNVVQRGKYYLVEFEVVDYVGAGTFHIQLGNAPSADGYVVVSGNGVFSVVLRSGDVSGAYNRLAIECKSAAGFSCAITYLHVTEVISGFNPVLFQDSGGITHVTAAEQPLGLIFDKKVGAGRGPQLLDEPSFNAQGAWVENGGTTSYSITGGQLVKTDSGVMARIEQPFVATMGKAYHVVVDCAANAGATWTFTLGGATEQWQTGAGFKSLIINPVAPGTVFYLRTSGTITVNSISVREITTDYLAMPTAAARPLLSARVNGMSNSQNFAAAWWTKYNSTVQSNTMLAPDGTMSADTITDNDTSGEHSIVAQGNAISLSGPRRHSIYAKQGTGRYLAMNGYNVLNSAWTCVFDLQDGVITDQGDPTYFARATIEDAGDGWWRISASTGSGSANLGYFAFGICNGPDATAANYVGTGSTIHIWGAQSENVPTVDSPATKYQRYNFTNDYEWKGFTMKARTDGVDDRLGATTALVYYPSFTSVQSVAYSSFDATLDSPVFGSTTPGNGFLTGRRPDMARFLYNVATSEYIDHPAAITVYTPEVITQGANAGQRIYRVNDEALQSVAGAFNSGFNATYPINVGYSQLTTAYERANIDWYGGVYINRALTQQEHDDTYNYYTGVYTP